MVCFLLSQNQLGCKVLYFALIWTHLEYNDHSPENVEPSQSRRRFTINLKNGVFKVLQPEAMTWNASNQKAQCIKVKNVHKTFSFSVILESKPAGFSTTVVLCSRVGTHLTQQSDTWLRGGRHTTGHRCSSASPACCVYTSARCCSSWL